MANTGLIVHLTQLERDKFALWLERSATDTEATIKQMEIIKVPDSLIKRHKQEAMAFKIVASVLRQYESQSL